MIQLFLPIFIVPARRITIIGVRWKMYYEVKTSQSMEQRRSLETGKRTNMGIRIQPREIEVPEDDPFKNDLLGRKEPVKILTHLVGALEGPCVLAVDAAWGTGKTTFLRMWAQHLRNQGFPVVEFNAWETDFSGDPFVALSTELTEGLHEYTDEPLATKIAETKKGAKEVLRRAVPGLIRLATAGILDLAPLMEKEVGQALASYAEDRLSEYQEAQKSVKAFRHVLQDMAKTLAQSRENRSLIVVIDELDRCRPSYAVELLEVAKHLFSVDYIVFVLAVNRPELAHSIKALYGSGFDAAGYFRRFFDMDFRLPDPERKAFIDAALDAIQIDEYFGRTQDGSARSEYGDVRKLLHGFFRVPDLSIRRIAQAIHRLGLVFASLRSDQRSFAITAVVALILRTIDADLYHRFHCGQEVSDLEVVDKVFTPSGAITLEEEVRSIFEKTIIFAAREVSGLTDSPLFQRYQKLVDAEESDPSSHNPDRKRGKEIIEWAEDSQRYGAHIGFRYSVQQIELLSSGLIGERSGTVSHNS